MTDHPQREKPVRLGLVEREIIQNARDNCGHVNPRELPRRHSTWVALRRLEEKKLIRAVGGIWFLVDEPTEEAG